MGWGTLTHRGEATVKASGTTVAVSPSQAIPVGAILHAFCVADNHDSADGETTNHSIADSQGNTWEKVREHQKGSGAAAAGICVSWFVCKVTTEIGTGDSVTLTTPTVVAKGICLGEDSVAAGKTYQIDGRNSAAANSPSPSVTVTGLSSIERKWIGFVGGERARADNLLTEDADYTSLDTTGFGTTGSGSTTNVMGWAASRLATITEDTYAPSFPTNTDWVDMLAAFAEVDEAGGGVTVTPAPASSVAAKVDPSVVLGSISLAPNPAVAIGQKVDPAVILGSLSVSPAAAAAIGEKVNPLVVLGPITFTPAPAFVIGSKVDPTVVISGGDETVTPAPAFAIGAKVDPAVVLGSVTVAPTPAAAIGDRVNPTVVLGFLVIAPAQAQAVGSKVDPVVVLGSLLVSPAAAAAVASIAGPAVILGSTSVTPAPAFAVVTTTGPIVFVIAPATFVFLSIEDAPRYRIDAFDAQRYMLAASDRLVKVVADSVEGDPDG